MPLQGNLSIERMCELARVSRASFYRSFHKQQPVAEELEVRSAIQQIAIEHRRRYGYRRISPELRRRGMQVNHKRVMRIMAEDKLLAVQPKSFVVTTNTITTFSDIKKCRDNKARGCRCLQNSAGKRAKSVGKSAPGRSVSKWREIITARIAPRNARNCQALQAASGVMRPRRVCYNAYNSYVVGKEVQ